MKNTELKFVIRKVDTSKATNKSIIIDLQHDTLPHDRIYPVNKGDWWIVYCDREPVAYAGMVPSSRWSDTGYMCRSGVREKYRGNGLQKRLIAVRKKRAKELGYNWIITDTSYNPASANNLIDCGFRMYEPSREWAYSYSCYWKCKL